MRTKKTKLVRNKADKPASPHIQTLTFNLLPNKCRFETLEGREHIVVPMVILTEGVHNGSDGPMYYPPEELSKTPASWNHKPIVVYHPEINGVGISACDPTVINNRKVGVMMNTKFEGGRLKSEAWIEKHRAEVVDNRVVEAIEGAKMMELSTGVFVDMESSAGKWGEEDYKGIARNFRPDHLALLPDQIGACSIKDGAGFLRNSEKGSARLSLVNLLQRMGLIDNEMSHNNISSSLSEALRSRFIPNPSKDGNGPWLWVLDVYSNFVVYEFNNKLFRLGYTASDTGVSLSDDDPKEVVRVTEYRTVEGAFVGNQSLTEGKKMNKKQLVDDIITANAGWAETDRAALMGYTDQQLATLAKKVEKSSTATATPPAAPAAAPATPPAPAVVSANTATVAAPAAPVEKKVVTLDGYIQEAPAELQEVLRNSISVHNEEKTRLVKLITENKNNVFTADDLNKRTINDLRGIARLAGIGAEQARVANYSGQAPITDNTSSSGEEALEVPTMNFTSK